MLETPNLSPGDSFITNIWCEMELLLRKLKKNQIAKIVRIEGTGEVSRRIRDMGMVPGVEIKVVGRAPLFDPVAVKALGTVITLRNNEADFIFVETDE